MAYSDFDYLARVVMSSTSGLPEDSVVNTFAFHGGSALTLEDAEIITDWIDRFYNVEDEGDQPVSSWIGESINRAGSHVIQFYKIVSGPLGAPLFEIPWLGPEAPGTTSNLPTEVAAVASFHATLVGQSEEVGATRPRARRRGRLFIGPLTTGAMQDAGAPQPTLNTDFQQALRFAMLELRDNSANSWSVWSRADEILRPVVGGWTDDAFDTQRRRGQAATARVNWGNQ